MRCLIVDDEPLAQQVLEDFVNRVPFLKLAEKCSSASEAIEIVRTSNIDLIFLDIQMPRLSGLDFIGSLQNPPQFILVTAYQEYALEGFNHNATDYLMKPVPFDRFLKAVSKAHELHILRQSKTQAVGETQANFIFVRSDYQTLKIHLDSIQYIEGLKDYVKIYTDGRKPVLTIQTMKGMSESLPGSQFMRIHKSFIVALNKITSVARNRVLIGEKWIPVGENYREEFRKRVFKT